MPVAQQRHRNAKVNPHWLLFPASAFGPSLMPEMRFYNNALIQAEQSSFRSQVMFCFPKHSESAFNHLGTQSARGLYLLPSYSLCGSTDTSLRWAKSDVRTFSFLKWLFSTGEIQKPEIQWKKFGSDTNLLPQTFSEHIWKTPPEIPDSLCKTTLSHWALSESICFLLPNFSCLWIHPCMLWWWLCSSG